MGSTAKVPVKLKPGERAALEALARAARSGERGERLGEVEDEVQFADLRRPDADD